MTTFFKSTPDSNGGFTTVEWNLRDYLTAKAIIWMFVMALCVVLTSLIPTVWLLLYFISDEKERRVENIVAMLAGIYYLIDYHNGWVTFYFLRIFLSDNLINIFTYYNAGLLITHTVLLFFDRKIWFSADVEDDSDRMHKFVINVVAIIIGGYILSHAIIPHVLAPVIIPN